MKSDPSFSIISVCNFVIKMRFISCEINIIELLLILISPLPLRYPSPFIISLWCARLWMFVSMPKQNVPIFAIFEDYSSIYIRIKSVIGAIISQNSDFIYSESNYFLLHHLIYWNISCQFSHWCRCHTHSLPIFMNMNIITKKFIPLTIYKIEIIIWCFCSTTILSLCAW